MRDVGVFRPSGEVLASAASLVVAMLFVVIGVWAIATWGLTELYADQWRQYPVFLEQAFPANVIAADNGHRTVFTSLIRWIENRTLAGNQSLQLAAGALFAGGALAVFFSVAWRDRPQPVPRRALAVAVFAFAVFWLGNARMLLHGNESSNVYLIVLSLVGGLALLSHPHATTMRLTGACLLGAVATFSFGSGLAAFAAFAVVLAVQHRYRDMVIAVAALVGTFVLYALSPDAGGVRGSLVIRPLANAHTAATWLSSMWVQLLIPFIEPGAGGALPPGVRDIAGVSARLYESLLGSPHRNPWPFAVVGWLGVAAVCVMSWRSFRDQALRGRTRLIALGIAWFAFGVAGIVSLGRLDYFDAHPQQIFANRYVPWSCLFWCGLIVARLAARPDASRSVAGTLVSAVAIAILAMGLLTTRGHAVWSEIVQQGVHLGSAGFAVDVVDSEHGLGETQFQDLAAGIPAIRAARISLFDWPESRRYGGAVSLFTTRPDIELKAMHATTISNRLGGAATRVEAEFTPRDGAAPARLLLVANGRAVGVLVRQASVPGWRYAGYANPVLDEDQLTVARIDDDGTILCWHRCGDAAPSASR